VVQAGARARRVHVQHRPHVVPFGLYLTVNGIPKPNEAVHDMQRPFRVLGVQQIALGALDKTKLHRLWVELLGVRAVGDYRSERENVDEDILALGSGPLRCEVDLMQPLDPARKPAVHEPPLNHIGLWVDDLRAAVDALTARGVRFAPGGIRKGASGHDICFIHPKGNDEFPIGGEGVLIELVQAPPDVIAATGSEDE
jgi:lactoylglutathione lyase